MLSGAADADAVGVGDGVETALSGVAAGDGEVPPQAENVPSSMAEASRADSLFFMVQASFSLRLPPYFRSSLEIWWDAKMKSPIIVR